MSGTDTQFVRRTGQSDLPAGGRRSGGPRPLVVFAASSAVLYALLALRNLWLFSTPTDEGSDFAANSILAYQAKHFDLLVGNYSRMHFSHPGPAFLYVQAFGEWLFHDILHAVPSPWNGQVLIILALNSALVGTALAVLSGWFRSWPVVGTAAAATVGYLAAHGDLVAQVWMPFLYFPPFLLLLTAAASVAAGRSRDLSALAVAGGLLVHGHAAFLLFAPVIIVVALGALAYHHRGARLAVMREHRRDWSPAAAVSGLFLLPMVLNLALHWPGELGKYLSYGRSDLAGGHSFGEVVTFALRFWPGEDSPAVSLTVALALFAGVAALAWAPRGGAGGRLLLAGVAMAALATGLFLGYAMLGIDDLSEHYTGLFSSAVPLLLLVLLATGAAESVRGRWSVCRAVGPVFAGTAVLAALVAAAASPTLRTPRGHVAKVPGGIEVIRARTGGGPALLETQHDAWMTMTALVIAGQRAGQRICLVDPFWTFMVTAEFVCDERDLRTGTRFLLSVSGSTPPDVSVLADFPVFRGLDPPAPATELSTPAG